MIAGTVLGMIIFVVIPLLWIMRWCLFSYKGFGTVKFVGLKGMPNEPIHVTGNTSYLALTSLIGKTLETDYFSKDGGTVPLEQLVHDLPQTNPVSENGTVQTLEYQGHQSG